MNQIQMHNLSSRLHKKTNALDCPVQVLTATGRQRDKIWCTKCPTESLIGDLPLSVCSIKNVGVYTGFIILYFQ